MLEVPYLLNYVAKVGNLEDKKLIFNKSALFFSYFSNKIPSNQALDHHKGDKGCNRTL